MIIEFVAQARAELIDAVAYYEGELSGLDIDSGKKWMNTFPGSRTITRFRDCDPAAISE